MSALGEVAPRTGFFHRFEVKEVLVRRYDALVEDFVEGGFLFLSIGCGNKTSWFIMRGNQAVEVAARWACFHCRDEILKFPWKYSQSLSCVGVVRNVRLPSKPTFRIDCL